MPILNVGTSPFAKMEERLYTQQEVVEMFCITPRTLQKWRRDGRIGYIRFNLTGNNLAKGIRIPQSAIDEFLKTDFKGRRTVIRQTGRRIETFWQRAA